MNRGHLLLLGLPFLTFALGGCNATPYQSLRHNGGFSDHPLGHGLFKISFQGNRFTPDSEAKDFTLLRCSEIALLNGCHYFEIIKAAPNNAGYAEVTIHLLRTPGNKEVTDAVVVEQAIRAKYSNNTEFNGVLNKILPTFKKSH
jgi:hypothetical protein